MNKKMKEACAAVADIFQACPEMWSGCAPALGVCGGMCSPNYPLAVSWCAIGGVQAALKDDSDGWDIGDALSVYAKKLRYPSAVDANNIGGREVAIKMLRMAAQS